MRWRLERGSRGPRIGLARVHGRSMEPTLRDGDRVLIAYGLRPRPGQLVVVRLPPAPSGPRPISVKRLTGRDPGDATRWWVERDNPGEGVDSWLLGGIPEPDVLAVVLWRLPRRRSLSRLGTRKGRATPGVG